MNPTPTPVRVRGKRKARPSTAGHPTPIPRGHKRARRPLAAVLASRRFRRRPTLESLPSEVLETVLLYSASFSLPRASPLLGLKLSDRVTLLRFFVWVFSDTWEQGFGVPRSQLMHHVGRNAQETDVPCLGDPHLQSAMLELPWVDMDFILQAQQAWADRYACGRWYQHGVPWRQDTRDPGDGHDRGFGHFNSHACFEADYQRALRTQLRLQDSCLWRTRDVHPQTRIPSELIVGPWNEEKQRRVFWLTRGGICLDQAALPQMPPWETKMQCLNNSVIAAPEPIHIIANCLMGAWVFLNLPRDVAARKLADLDRRIAREGDSPESLALLCWARTSLARSLGLTHYPGI